MWTLTIILFIAYLTNPYTPSDKARFFKNSNLFYLLLKIIHKQNSFKNNKDTWPFHSAIKSCKGIQFVYALKCTATSQRKLLTRCT